MMPASHSTVGTVVIPVTPMDTPTGCWQTPSVTKIAEHPKKVISLLGVATTGPWAWNGSKKQLEEQVHTSLLISMQSQLATEELPIEPLAAYLRTLQPPPGIAASRKQLPDPQILQQARLVFRNSGCSNCHAGESLTTDDVFDVGIHDEQGETNFNPPGLAGVSQRGPWFHDGRATSLEDVLRSGHHDQSVPQRLTNPAAADTAGNTVGTGHDPKTLE